MMLRPFFLSDYEAVVDMYYDFTREVFTERKIGYKYFFYKTVQEWIKKGNDIVLVTTDDGEIVGFSMAFYDDFGGLTEPFYNGEIAYVKPEYRKSKAAYLLYNNVVEVAKERNLLIVANGRVENGIDKMIKKHYKATPMFINFERKPNG